MNELRRTRIESALLDELVILIQGIVDDRIPALTLTSLKIAADGRSATIGYVLSSWLADRVEHPDIPEERLAKVARFLRRELVGRTELRTIPELFFKRDRGFENKTRIEEILSGSVERRAPHQQA